MAGHFTRAALLRTSPICHLARYPRPAKSPIIALTRSALSWPIDVTHASCIAGRDDGICPPCHHWQPARGYGLRSHIRHGIHALRDVARPIVLGERPWRYRGMPPSAACRPTTAAATARIRRMPGHRRPSSKSLAGIADLHTI